MLLGKTQKTLLLLTDAGMLAYWFIVGLDGLGIIQINPENMYSDYQNPLVVAWNLSFLPIDLTFAVLGLAGLLLNVSDKTKELFTVISLSLMFCAGLMAASFWFIVKDFQFFWWTINLWLIALPIGILIRSRR